MFEFLRKTPTVVGLDISSTAVKLLELSQDKGQYRVESYGVEVIPENAIVEKNIADIDAVGGAIKRVRQKSKTKVKEVGVAVAGSSVITKTLELANSKVLVMTEDPATATPTSFTLVFDFWRTRLIAPPTASMSAMFFSTIAFSGITSTP